MDEYGAELIRSNPRDVLSYCPRYRALGPADRKLFWMQLLSAVVNRESSYRSSEAYTETFRDRTGERETERHHHFR